MRSERQFLATSGPRLPSALNGGLALVVVASLTAGGRQFPQRPNQSATTSNAAFGSHGMSG